jgi:3-hydroxyacyl-CoA dehydrogenase
VSPADGPHRRSETVSSRRDGDVLVVVLDAPPVNAVSRSMREGLLAALAAATAREDVAAIVVTGAGSAFVGGADIREFDAPITEPTLPEVTAALEASTKPVIAAIDGVALGGGLELALACHRRVATRRSSFALPEVKLGIVPGAGGTQRLPRLIGIAAAIDLVPTGRSIGAVEALGIGLVDEVVDADAVAAAIAAVAARRDPPPRRTVDLAVPFLAADEIGGLVAAAKARARGRPAPLAAIRLVAATAEASFAAGLAEERATFLELRASDEAAALRHVFFAERAAAKVAGLDDVAAPPVATIGIVGLGLMGGGIATAAAIAGYRVVGVEQSAEAAEAGAKRIADLIERAGRSGRLGGADAASVAARVTTGADLAVLADADLVIEAVIDDHDTKADLFARLDGIVAPDAILATNTSYLDPDRLAEGVSNPRRVVGLHFFSPAHVMRLVEVVRCAKTAPEVLATVIAVARRLGKLPVTCGVCEGFIGNRIFSAYRREAEYLLEDGASPQTIDAAMEAYGFAMGPFAVFDLAGLEIAWARRKRTPRDPAVRYVDVADRLCEAGRFGAKIGHGWWDHVDGRRVASPEVAALIEASRAAKGILARPVTADEIVARLTGAMVAEGRALLAEGIAARASDIDLVMINGYGFPAHRGGPMWAAGQGAQG